jgi:hypothetical protein
MIDGGNRLSEEEARRVWKRAADLQAAVADPQSRAPAVPTDSGQQTGYAVRQVCEAAAEVGIGPEFVVLALAEGQDTASPSRAACWCTRSPRLA